jgi:hypothetical protein
MIVSQDRVRITVAIENRSLLTMYWVSFDIVLGLFSVYRVSKREKGSRLPKSLR